MVMMVKDGKQEKRKKKKYFKIKTLLLLKKAQRLADIWTHNIWIMRRVLYRCATTAALPSNST